jgi:predicted kinase
MPKREKFSSLVEICTKVMEFQPHCVILLVGPSNAGKTTLSQHLFHEAEEQLGSKSCLVLSSDKIRDRLLCGHESDSWTARTDKYAPRMLAVSEAAFQILEMEYVAAMRYPVSKPVIIIDSTALSEIFRNKMMQLARDHHYAVYAVVFNLDNDDLLKHEPAFNPDQKTLIMQQQRRLRTEVLGSLKGFTKHYRVTSKTTLEKSPAVTFVGAALYQESRLDPTIKWHVIGDTHGSYDPLMALLRRLPGVSFAGIDDTITLDERTGLVLAGDFVDKGAQVDKLLRWIHDHMAHPRIKLVVGNHERRVWNILQAIDRNQEIKSDIVSREEEGDTSVPYFDHAPVLAMDPELKQIFYEVYDKTLPFVCLEGWHSNQQEFIVTHAPCENKYLGKIDPISQRQQRYYHYSMADQYSAMAEFLRQQHVNTSAPYHIFGHCPVAEPRILGQQIVIDTGCGLGGGRLTAVTLNWNKTRPKFTTVPDLVSPLVLQEKARPLINIPYMRQEADKKDRDPKLLGKALQLRAKKINFVSGTISPAGSRVAKAAGPEVKEEDPEVRVEAKVERDGQAVHLESLVEALGYFKARKVNRVVLQPKYMGSRCQVYLFPNNLEQCYAVSRNGYIIRFEGDYLKRFQDICLDLIKRLQQNARVPEFALAIVDAELLPWSYLGDGLIDDYLRYGYAHRQHLQLLQKYGFDQVLAQDQQFSQNFSAKYATSTTKKEEVLKKMQADGLPQVLYGKNIHIQTLEKQFIPVKQQLEGCDIYDRQIRLFGAPTKCAADMHIKPFEILKLVLPSGEEKVLPYSADEAFQILQEDDICVVSLAADDFCTSVEKAQVFFDFLAQCLEMEGVVVKALDGNAEVPFLKVRNANYLTLIYGPNFPYLPQFAKAKKTSRKMRESEIEWGLGKKMLEQPYATLADSKPFLEVAYRFLSEEVSFAAHMDARL